MIFRALRRKRRGIGPEEIKQGKANFDVAWNQKGDYSAGVEARVNDDLTLLIIYNSPQGEAERLRRNSKPDPNL